jgi:hypothetical protein
MKNPDRATVSRLIDLPNVGEAIACKLRLVGIDKPSQLIGKNPFELYEKLCTESGQRYDPCVIDVFMSVVHFMGGGEPRPWWSFTPERKSTLLKYKRHEGDGM